MNKWTAWNLNDINIYENNVTFVQIYIFLNVRITLID